MLLLFKFPLFGGINGKEPACQSRLDVRDMASIPGLGRSPGGGHSNPFQYSRLENPHGQKSLVGFSPVESDRLK